jgi:hypothetical protein
MKKSKKPPITSDQILEDFDKIMSFVNKLDGQDLTKINFDELGIESENIKKEIEKKYNPIINKLKKDLDSEE